jgi:hypothetical protein
MLWQCASPEQRSTLRAVHTLNNPQKYTRLLGGLSPIHFKCWCRTQGLTWGTREKFLLGVAMVVGVVTPDVFVLRLLKNVIKMLKLVFS